MTKPEPAVDLRADAARQIHAVLAQGRSLNHKQERASNLAVADLALVQEIVYGVLRHYWSLAAQLKPLLRKPFKNKDAILHSLLLVGLYQLHHLRVPAYAAVAETVSATVALKRPWARALINAVLRQSQRSSHEIGDQDPTAKYDHPGWIIDAIRDAWPNDWQGVLVANNQRPPMVLRVNRLQIQRSDYLLRLNDDGLEADPLTDISHGIELRRPVEVNRLPNFSTGQVSVQSPAAQQVVEIMALAPEQRVLDACAAPGGKTAHILETQQGLDTLLALDLDPLRVKLLESGLNRLRLQADCRQADAADLNSWWDGNPFDRILLDAPCSGSGVICRHPDIKHLRRIEDIHALVQTQRSMLESLWQALRPGGRLVYTTCSVLPAENEGLIKDFLASHPAARAQNFELALGRKLQFGWQCLSGRDGSDGFYYAALIKN